MAMRTTHQGGSVQYEDTVGVDGDSGVSILGFRNDADAQLATADLSHTRLSADEFGRLKIIVITNIPPAGVAAAAAYSDEPAANTAAVVTLAAGAAGVSNVLGMVVWSYDLLTVAGTLVIEDGGGTTVLKIDIPESGPGFIKWEPGLAGTAATAMIVTLAAGGAGVSGIVNVHAWTQG